MYPVNLQVLYPQAEHERGGQREELQQERRVLQREGSLGRTRIFGLGSWSSDISDPWTPRARTRSSSSSYARNTLHSDPSTPVTVARE